MQDRDLTPPPHRKVKSRRRPGRDATVRLDPAGAEARAREMLADRVAAIDLPVTDAAADADHVEVVVRGEVDVTLLRVLRPDAGPWAVSVRVVVEPRMTRRP